MPDYLVFTVLGVLLAFFVLPISVVLRISRRDFESPVELDVRWAFFQGLAGIHLRRESPSWYACPLIFGIRFPRPRLRLTGRPKRPRKETPEKPAAASKPRPPVAKTIARVRLLIELLASPAVALFRKLPDSISMRRFCVNGSFGMADPAATGKLCGLFQALRGWNYPPLTLSVRPEFGRRGLQGTVSLSIHLHHGYALLSVLRFASTVAYRYLARFAGDKVEQIQQSLFGAKPEKPK